jgi:hypothetical protein
MKARMADPSFQALAVQKVRFLSVNAIIPRFPGARFA